MNKENKILSILGSTGSIGTQSIEVARQLGYKISSLSTNSNISVLENQIREFKPKVACVYDDKKAKELKLKVADTNTKIVSGVDGLCEVATQQESDIVLTSVVGMIGLVPTIEAIKAKKTIALANKETLVTAGEIVTKLAKQNNVKIIPVDSEHSAIFQCLQGINKKVELKKIILTASGGPFFGKSYEQLKAVTLENALKHPNWTMGAKISIDSATLMNKGLELIEAFWLFDVLPNQIKVIIHRESIIHSMIELVDNSVIAQLSEPDMKLAIQYALTYPNRFPSDIKNLDLIKYGSLTFNKPDIETFKCLKICMSAIKKGGTLPCAINVANEEAVTLFLNKKITFVDIFSIVEEIYKSHKTIINPTLNDILQTELITREKVRKLII